jgi:hypothetical protein
VLGRHRLGRGRGTAEVDRRRRGGQLRAEPAGFHLVVLAREVERFGLPRLPDHLQELRGAFVALVVGEEVAVGALLAGIAAGDDVQQEPAPADPLQRRGHVCGECRHDETWPERDQELQPLGVAHQCGHGKPGVLTPGAGGREDAGEAEPVRGPRHLGEVLDVRGPVGRRDVASVAGRGQEPVDVESHANSRVAGIGYRSGQSAVSSSGTPRRVRSRRRRSTTEWSSR